MCGWQASADASDVRQRLEVADAALEEAQSLEARKLKKAAFWKKESDTRLAQTEDALRQTQEQLTEARRVAPFPSCEQRHGRASVQAHKPKHSQKTMCTAARYRPPTARRRCGLAHARVCATACACA